MVLKDKIDNDPAVKRRMENHHRNNKKNQIKGAHRLSEKASSAAASPGLAGQARKMASRESEKPSHRSHSNGDNRHSERPESRHHDKGTPDRRHRQSDQYRPSENRRKEHRADRDSVDRRPPPSDRKVSGDVQKSRSKDERPLPKDERPLPKEERPRSQEERPKLHSQVRGPSVERAASTPNEAEKKLDPFLERKLNNMQPNLKRLKKCTPKHYSKDQMVKRLKVELLAIGNFITHTARENSQTPDLEDRLW
jgi:chromodomain-helicase-DNA-binding protein 1